MTQKLATFLLVMVCAIAGTAQIKKADEAFAHHHYEEAIELYNKVIRKDLDNANAITNLAVAYWKTDQGSLAEYWFTRAALMNDDPRVKLWYSQLLISNEKYDLASNWLDKYASAELDGQSASNARKMSAWCKSIKENGLHVDNCMVSPVSFNSPELDFAPVLVGDVLFFTSNREGATERLGEDDPWTTSRFTDVFKTQRTGKNKFGPVVPVHTFGNTSYHEGPLCFSADGMTCIMTKSDFDEKKRRFDDERNTRLKLVMSSSIDRIQWSKTVELPMNNSEYSVVHPSLSVDGQTMIFASDMPGGMGGMDLYVSKVDAQGKWGEPINVGHHVNTIGNEVFPTIGASGDLVFSSDLHVGFGGLDLYKCVQKNDKWDIPENMGAPLNSPKDDFGLCWDTEGKTGFFSSNRNVSTKDDILFFEFSANVLVEGQILDCASREPVSGAEMTLIGDDYFSDLAFSDEEGKFMFHVPAGQVFELSSKAKGYIISTACKSVATIDTQELSAGDEMRVNLALSPEKSISQSVTYACGRIINANYGNPLSGVAVELFDRCTGETINLITEEGGTFYMPVSSGCEFDLIGTKDKFHQARATFNTMFVEGECLEITVGMEIMDNVAPPLLSQDVLIRKGMVLELFHIYFDRDKSDIRDDAIPDLKTLYEILLKHPDLKGEIMAHTDSRAAHEYNIELSNRRALAAKNWLINQGIGADRLTAVGYGETMLKNHCADDFECTEEEHQRNRRVEFRVTDVGSYTDERSQEK
ncbi:MAG: outer membrane protein OmpA-like peptidoglycan-associated protein [Flavobacteriales bacterium]|jgi:outer membrane protein OmpA-like peptidoglycan-associated protein